MSQFALSHSIYHHFNITHQARLCKRRDYGLLASSAVNSLHLMMKFPSLKLSDGFT